MISTDFILASLVVVLIPGTGVIYTVTTGLFMGAKPSVAAAAGCTAGIMPHLLAGILGLSAVVHAGAVAFQVVKWVGAAYLIWLAWSMWRQTGVLEFKAPKKRRGLRKLAVRGFLINILNPKLSIFFVAFLPLFVSTAGPSPTQQMFMLGAAFMGMTLAIFILYGLCANMVRRHVVHSPRLMTWLQRSFAATFGLLGAKLIMTDQ